MGRLREQAEVAYEAMITAAEAVTEQVNKQGGGRRGGTKPFWRGT